MGGEWGEGGWGEREREEGGRDRKDREGEGTRVSKRERGGG